MSWLKSTMECRFGLNEAVSLLSLRLLKSPIKTHGISCKQAMIRTSCKNARLLLLSVGPYTFVSMNWNPRLLERTIVVE
jgi:hypothetical protein